MKKAVLYVLVSMFFVSCSSVNPPVIEYKIQTPTTEALDAKSCKSKSLKVSKAFSLAKYMSLDMKYTQGDIKEYSYSKSRWASSVNRTVSEEIFKHVRGLEVFLSVQNSKSRTKSDWVLETNIEEFMQHYDANSKKSSAEIAINFTILDSHTSQVIDSKLFRAKSDAKSLNAEGGVEALNLAFKDILAQSSNWFGDICR